MKKMMLLCAVLSVSIFTMAQNRTLGARLAGGLEVSYQYSMGDANMIELDAGFWSNGVGLYGLYDWIMPVNTFDNGTELNWYAGVGGGFGSFWTNSSYHDDDNYNTYLCVAGQVGLEYFFNFPLQLSIDFRPALGLGAGDDYGFYNDTFHGGLTLGVRYVF